MKTLLFMDDLLFKYGFPDHPLTPRRYSLFKEYLSKSGLLDNPSLIVSSSKVPEDSLLTLFHSREYVDRVKYFSGRGYGLLDMGDTPAYKGVYEVSASSAYATSQAIKAVYERDVRFAVNLAGGWHHAMRDSAGGFCVFNDIGVGIEYLRKIHSNKNIRFYYIDIDAHHGDGVYYPYESDPYVYIFDIHESGRFLYPGTGFEYEAGSGDAVGTKRNIVLEPYSGDDMLLKYIDEAYRFGLRVEPDLIILQGGLDGLEGDPLTHLKYSVDGYLSSVKRIIELALELDVGLVYLGGGGYQPDAVARTWVKVLDIMINI